MSASSPSTAMWSLFPFSLSPTVNSTSARLFCPYFRGHSTGRNIFSHRLVFILALGELVFDHVADRHHPDELFIPDNRKVARALIGHFFHSRIDAFILRRCDHVGGHEHGHSIVKQGGAAIS